MAITVTGSLQVKYNTWYAVINYKDENGKRKQKWIPTGYPVKGNKKRANEVLQAKIKEYNNKNVSFFYKYHCSRILQIMVSAYKRRSKT